jgi:glycerol kinase
VDPARRSPRSTVARSLRTCGPDRAGAPERTPHAPGADQADLGRHPATATTVADTLSAGGAAAGAAVGVDGYGASMPYLVAIDAGTTGIRSLAVDHTGAVRASSYREFTQHFPRPGWVEHDASEIWDAARATLVDLLGRIDEPPAAIGITNQRETVVAWDRRTGAPLHRAIVWQDRRTAERCDELAAEGLLPLVRSRTGLVLDPYFSGTKIEWLMRHGHIGHDPALALGTIDSWLIWNLTGGEVHVTDPSNASRTMLYDIVDRRWSESLCQALSVPVEALPAVVPSSGRIGVTSARCGVPAGIPISGIAGDQQAALFGQACLEPGMTKNTYGTGSFVLMNVGHECPPPTDGLLTTVAWQLADGSFTYALEGSVFVTGAAIQWLRDGLGIIAHAAETEPLARSVDSSDGVVFVPAFTGLGSPWWDPYARGAILGLTRGSTRAHLARAVVEAMAYQTRDVVDAMASAGGTPVRELRVDGGAAVMDLLLEIQADQIGVPVARPSQAETTALGAAFLAGLAEGIWASPSEVTATWRLDRRVLPAPDRRHADEGHRRWRRGVDRSRHWAVDGI